MLKMTID